MRTETFEIGFGLKKEDSSYGIIRMDSAKMFTLYPETKTYTYWDLSAVMKDGNVASLINSNGGNGIMKDHQQEKEFLGMEVIEGYECKHYRYKLTTTLSNGATSVGYREGWFYEPLKIEMQWEDGGEVFVIRNLKQGPQPASLFEIPKDYKNATKTLSGNPLEEIEKMQEMLKEGMKGSDGKSTKQNSEGKSEAEKIQDALQMLEGLNSKKK
jgi:hypothetical protein